MTEFTSFSRAISRITISTASAPQESQIRIENQLQQMLRAQSRAGAWQVVARGRNHAQSCFEEPKSLDQTTKKTLEDFAASPDIAAFKMAVEYLSFSSPAGQALNAFPAVMDSASMLNPDPPRGATFLEHLNALSRQPSSYLEHGENIEDGMRCLMGGMAESIDSADMFQQLGSRMD